MQAIQGSNQASRRIRCSTPAFQGTAGVLTMASSASISFNRALIEISPTFQQFLSVKVSFVEM